MPLDPNAASVHPMVTIPLALATARRATPPRPALRPSHLLPSAPGRRRDGPFCFHPAEPRPDTGAIGASIPLRLCPVNGPVTISGSAGTATDPSARPSRRGCAPPAVQSPSARWLAPAPTHPGHHQAEPRIVTTMFNRRRREQATIPLDPNAARLQHMVTSPSAAATARRATPPRPALRPSHLLPSVCRPALRRTISFPSRRASPRHRRHRGFHPVAALPRQRSSRHQRFSLPRDGPSWFHPAAALPRARTSHHHRFSLHRDRPIRATIRPNRGS